MAAPAVRSDGPALSPAAESEADADADADVDVDALVAEPDVPVILDEGAAATVIPKSVVVVTSALPRTDTVEVTTELPVVDAEQPSQLVHAGAVSHGPLVQPDQVGSGQALFRPNQAVQGPDAHSKLLSYILLAQSWPSPPLPKNAPKPNTSSSESSFESLVTV